MPLRDVPLAAIDTAAKTQTRAKINRETVGEYAALLEEGVELPPIVAYTSGAAGTYAIADGWHRYLAHVELKRKKIQVQAEIGTERDALSHALRANASHGLQRTSADRRKAVGIALDDEEWGLLGSRGIAKLCGVSRSLVVKIQKEREAPEPEEEEEAAPSDPDDIFADEEEVAWEPEEETVLAPKKLSPVDEIAKLASQAQEITDLLRTVKAKIRGLADHWRCGHLGMALDPTLALLDEVRSSVASNTPVEICGLCEASGCVECAQTGVRTRYQLALIERGV